MPNISRHSFNTTIPSVFVRSAVLSPAKNRAFTVDINFMLKVLDGAPTDHLQSRLRMAVCLITDQGLLNRMLKYPKFMRGNIRNTQNDSMMKKQYIGFESSCLCSCEEMGNNKEIINTADGSYVNNYKYNVNFSLTDKTYNYLGCLIVPYYANPQNESITGLNRDGSQFVMGEYCVEDLLMGNKPTAVRLAYKLDSSVSDYGSKDQYWVGSTHKGPNNVAMAGQAHHSGDHPSLDYQRLANKKVIDRRIEMQLTKNELSHISDELESIVGKTTSSLQVLKSIKSKDYFSGLSFSRQRDGSLRLFFNADIGKIAQNSLKYSFLYNTAAELRAALSIKSASLSRKRVGHPELNNKLTGVSEAPPVFNPSEKEKVVSSLNEDTLQMFAAPGDFSKQSFVGQDREMAFRNDGFYQYKVEIGFVDSSPAKFSKLITDFEKVLANYDKFVSTATRPGGYNCSSYSFNERRIQELYAGEQESWKEMVSTYLATLVTLGGDKVAPSFDIGRWQKALLGLTDPRSATMDTLLLMQKLATTLLGKLALIRNVASVTGNSDAMSYRSTIEHVSSDAAFIEIQRTFLTAYKAKNKRNVGLDYMPDIARSTGLPRYDLDSWKKRTGHEIARYGATVVTTANVNGYLSPRVIVLSGGNNILVTSDMQFGSSAISVLLAYFDPTGHANSGGFSPSAGLPSKKRKLLGISGVSVQSFPRGFQAFIIPGRSCQSLIASERVLGKGSRFILEPETEGDKAKLKGVNDPEEKILESGFVDSLIEGMSADFGTAGAVDISQISDSLVAKNIEKVMRKNSFDFGLNANAALTVEYLAGFNNGHVADPIWNKVTGDSIANLSSNDYLVCRLSPNTSITGKINTYTKAFPTYNDIFVIGSSPKYTNKAADTIMTTAVVPIAPLNNQGYMDLPIEYWKSRSALDSGGTSGFGTSGFGTSGFGTSGFGDGSYETTFGDLQGIPGQFGTSGLASADTTSGFGTTAMTRTFNTGGNRGGGGSSGY